MAKVEVEQETGGQARAPRKQNWSWDCPAWWTSAQVQAAAAQWSGSGHRIAVVHPCAPGMSEALETLDESGEVRLVAREVAAVASTTAPWLGQPAVYAALLAEAESLGASACVILNPDLAAFTPAAVDALVRPILERSVRPGHAALSRRTLRWTAEPGDPRPGHARAVWHAGALSAGAGLCRLGGVSAGVAAGDQHAGSRAGTVVAGNRSRAAREEGLPGLSASAS